MIKVPIKNSSALLHAKLDWIKNWDVIEKSKAHTPPVKNNISLGNNWTLVQSGFILNNINGTNVYTDIFIKIKNNHFYAVGYLCYINEIFQKKGDRRFFGILRKLIPKLTVDGICRTVYSLNSYVTCDLNITDLKYAGSRKSIKKFLKDFNQVIFVRDVVLEI